MIKRDFPLNFICRSLTEPRLFSKKKKKKGVAIDHSGQADKYWPAVTSQSSRRLEAGPLCPTSGKPWKDIRWNQWQDVNRRQTLTSCRVLHLRWTSVASLGCRAVNCCWIQMMLRWTRLPGSTTSYVYRSYFLATECRQWNSRSIRDAEANHLTQALSALWYTAWWSLTFTSWIFLVFAEADWTAWLADP